MDQPQCVFEAFISCRLVVLVRLHVEVCDVVHHLQHRSNPRKDILYTSLKQTEVNCLHTALSVLTATFLVHLYSYFTVFCLHICHIVILLVFVL